MEDIAAVLDKAPLGFGFRPTDEELVEYLRHKLLGDDDRFNIFPVIDLCKVEPWQVPGLPIIKSDDPQRFFFSPVDYKYSNSKRVNRTTKCGFCKSTGQDRYIKVSETDDVIWTKKTLVYYEGRVPNGVKSNWVIHEYHAEAVTFPENQRRLVLCHLMYKAGKGGIDAKICDEGEPSTGGHIASSDHENMATEERVPPVDVLPEMRVETIFQPMRQEEIDFTPLQQCPNSIEQEISFTSFPADNAYFKNENSVMQTPFETTKEGNEFPTLILPPIQLGIEQEASLTSFLAHNACSINENCNVQIPFETIAEGNAFPTSIMTPIHQPQISIIEQEASFTSFPVDNACFRNEDCNMQTPFKPIEEENEFLTSILAPIQQSSIGIIEQEACFKSFSALNAYYRNEDCYMQTPVETNEGENESLISIFGSLEEEKEFLGSIFADENFVSNVECGHVFVNNSSTQPESLKRVHCESHDANVEVASALYGNIVDTSTMCNEHPSLSECCKSKRLKSTHGMVDGGIHLVSFDQEANNEESIIQNDFWRVETSSCDSTTDQPLEANCVEISSSSFTLKRWKNKQHPRPSNFISQKTTARRSQRQRKASSNEVSHLEVRKSNNDIREMEKPT